MNVRSGLFAVALIGASMPAQAADWYHVEETGLGHTYLDADSVTRSGDRAQVLEYVIWNPDAGVAYPRIRTLLELDCVRRTYAYLELSGYDAAGRLHTENSARAPRDVQPGTVIATILAFACGNRSGERLVGSTPEEDAGRRFAAAPPVPAGKPSSRN